MNTSNHVIDCSVQPFCPDKRQILPPKKQIPTRFRASLVWDMEKQKKALYLSERQTESIVGNDLVTELIEKCVVVLPANVLDYLLANPHLIPEEWKGKVVFFWGTIYRDPSDFLFVRSLWWGDGHWSWGNRWLGRDFDSCRPAALSASQN